VGDVLTITAARRRELREIADDAPRAQDLLDAAGVA
jgi:hypothetical protein